MQDKVELGRIRTFGEIIDDSILFFKQNIKPLMRAYVTICGFFWVASIAISIVNQLQISRHIALGESRYGFTFFFTMVFNMLSGIMMLITILSYIALYKEKEKEAPSVEEVWAYVKYYFIRIFGSYMALAVCLAVGFVCCIIPGIYLAIVFALLFPVMVMENATLGYAFSRSFQLIKNNWWHVLGIIIVTDIIIVVAMFSIVIPVTVVVLVTQMLSTFSSANISAYAVIAISHLLQFLYIIPIIAVTLCYFSLTEQKDDGSLLQRIMNIGKHDAATEQQTTEEY